MFEFRSIRTFVTLTAGACLLAVVLALVGYALTAISDLQEETAARSETELSESIQARLTARAEQQAASISARLENALHTARELAETNAMMAGAGSTPALPIDRHAMSMIVRQRVIDHPELLDAFIGWEPNAFDNDRLYAGMTSRGYGADGRFMPWWYRTEDGSVEVLGLGETMESTAVMDSGVREGEYYLCPRETGRACVIDPTTYDYNGEEMLVTSFNVPIMVDGEFRGSAGVDLSLDFIQGLLESADQTLYGGAGDLALVSGGGVIVGDSSSPESTGLAASTLFEGEALERLRTGVEAPVLTQDSEQLAVQVPVDIGADNRWQLLLRLPTEAAFANFNALQQSLAAQQSRALWTMVLVGLGVSALGLLLLWGLGGRIARPLRRLAERMRDIADGEGDLTRRLPVAGRAEPAQLAIAFNHFVERMEQTLLDIRDASHQVENASSEISVGGHHLSQRTESAAASLEESAAAMEELTSTVVNSAQSSRQANELAFKAARSARDGGEQMESVVATMGRIRDTSGEITGIIDMIDAIAARTNLLALNASVEAARAGEQGRGFAVVAEEVRSLAGRSAQASKDIRTLIDTATRETESGAALVNQASLAINDIVARVEEVSAVIDELSYAADEQSGGIGQVNQAVTQLDDTTQQNAALVEQSAASAESLKQQAQRLAQAVGAFQLSERKGQEVPALGSDQTAYKKT